MVRNNYFDVIFTRKRAQQIEQAWGKTVLKYVDFHERKNAGNALFECLPHFVKESDIVIIIINATVSSLIPTLLLAQTSTQAQRQKTEKTFISLLP